MDSALSLGLPALVGYLALSLVWPECDRRPADVVFRVSLAVPAGCGLSSCVYVFWLAFFGRVTPTLRLVETAIWLCVAALMFWRLGNRTRIPPSAAPQAAGKTGATLGLCAILLVILLAAGVFIARSVNMPHGGTDAWTIWNLHARFLYRAGDEWARSLARLHWLSHPDYPLLVPATVARCWSMLGKESVIAPIFVAGLFTFGTVVLLISAVTRLRGLLHGMFAGLMLLAIPGFIVTGAAQIGDVPLSFFILATLALLCLHDGCLERPGRLLWLSGMMAGLAAWTKNEGLLFLPAIAAARLWALVPSDGWRRGMRQAACVLGGAAPFVALTLWYKLAIATGNDLLRLDNVALVARAADWRRMLVILETVPKELFGLLGFRGAVFAACFILLGIAPQGRLRTGIRTGIGASALMLCGEIAVFFITPHDVVWHMQASLQRLYVQLLPMALLITCLAAGPATRIENGLPEWPKEPQPDRSPARPQATFRRRDLTP